MAGNENLNQSAPVCPCTMVPYCNTDLIKLNWEKVYLPSLKVKGYLSEPSVTWQITFKCVSGTCINYSKIICYLKTQLIVGQKNENWKSHYTKAHDLNENVVQTTIFTTQRLLHHEYLTSMRTFFYNIFLLSWRKGNIFFRKTCTVGLPVWVKFIVNKCNSVTTVKW